MSKKNIILLHGWGTSAEKLKPLASELKKLGWNVLLPKLPGFDLKVPKEVWGLEEYADFVQAKAEKYFSRKKRILKQVQDDEVQSYYVFGHSFGGRIAIKMALQNFSVPPSEESIRPPRRSNRGNKVSSLILCASGGISRGNPLKRAILFCLAKAGKSLNIFPRCARFWKKLLYKLAHEHDYEKADGVMRDVFKKVISEDLKKVVHSIKAPTLILWGKEDRMTPYSDALFLNQIINGSKLVSFSGQGHTLPYRKSKEIAREIDKWTGELSCKAGSCSAGNTEH